MPEQKTEAKRFKVDGRHVSWLGWEYDFHFSPLAAAQLFNIKFNGERWVCLWFPKLVIYTPVFSISIIYSSKLQQYFIERRLEFI